MKIVQFGEAMNSNREHLRNRYREIMIKMFSVFVLNEMTR